MNQMDKLFGIASHLNKMSARKRKNVSDVDVKSVAEIQDDAQAQLAMQAAVKQKQASSRSKTDMSQLPLFGAADSDDRVILNDADAKSKKQPASDALGINGDNYYSDQLPTGTSSNYGSSSSAYGTSANPSTSSVSYDTNNLPGIGASDEGVQTTVGADQDLGAPAVVATDYTGAILAGLGALGLLAALWPKSDTPTPAPTPAPVQASVITTTIDPTISQSNVSATKVTGSVTNFTPGSNVVIRISDSDTTTPDVTVTAVVDASGNYSTSAILSSLKDGAIHSTATATGLDGLPVSAVANASMQLVPNFVTVAIPSTISMATESLVPVTGSTSAVKPGAIVTVVIDDTNPLTPSTTATAVVKADGTYTTTANVSGMSDGTITANATTTDVNNTVVSGTGKGNLDATIPATLALTIDLDADNNGYINKAEKGSSTTSPVTAAFDKTMASVGDIVTFTDATGAKQTVTLTAADVAAGKVSTQYATPADGATMTVTALMSDAAGNTSAKATDSAKIDLSDLNNPAGNIQITTDNNNDGVINNTEFSASGTSKISVKYKLPTAAVAGDVVVLSGTGDTNQTITLTTSQVSAGFVTADFKSPGDGVTFTTTAVVSDSAGNVSTPVTDLAVLNLTPPPAPIVTILSDTNSDGYLNSTELNGITRVGVKVMAPVGSKPGDIMNVTDGASVETRTLTASDISNGITTTFPIPATEGGKIVVSAYITDAIGNKGTTGSNQAIKDTVVSNITNLTIDQDVNNDGFINRDEKGSATTSSVTATFDSTKVKTGDLVVFTDANNKSQTVTLTNADVTAGKVSVSGYDIPADGKVLTVTAHIQDAAGNTSPNVVDTALVDLSNFTGTKITITTDADNNGTINAGELASTAGKVNVSVDLPVDAKAGDKVTITGTGTNAIEIVLGASDIAAGKVTTSFLNPGDVKFTATAKVTDGAGNSSPVVQDSATISTAIGGSPGVSIVTDANNDGYINKSELGVATTASVTVTQPTTGVLPTSPPIAWVAGDVISLAYDGDATHVLTHTLTAAEATAKTYTFTNVPLPAQGATMTVTAKVTDTAGNSSPSGVDKAILDTSNLAPIKIVLDTDGNKDGHINPGELGASNNRVVATVALPPDAAVGDTLTVNASGNTPWTHTLTQADITAGHVTHDFSPTGPKTTFTVSASLADNAGNASPLPDASAAADITDGMAAPTVAIHNITTVTQAGVQHNYLNASALGAATTVDVEYKLPASALAGYKLTVNMTGTAQQVITLTQAQIDAGSVTLQAPRPADGTDITATATLTDTANTTSSLASQSATIDTTISTDLTVTIDADENNDGYLNPVEIAKLSTSTTPITAHFKTADVHAGDVVTFTSDTGSPKTMTATLTAADVSAGKVSVNMGFPSTSGAIMNVTAQVTDMAGNNSNLAKDAVTIDTISPTLKNLSIDQDQNNDGFINRLEKGASTTTTVTANFNLDASGKTQDVQAGDLVVFTDNTTATPTVKTVTLVAADITVGHVSTTFNIPADGIQMKVTAIVKDAASNQSALVSDTAIVDLSDFTQPAPTIHITTDANADKIINQAEITANSAANGGKPLTAIVTLPTDVRAGDSVTVTGTGNADQTVTLTQADVTAGKISVNFATANDGDFIATAKVQDAAGNTSAIVQDQDKISTIVPGAPEVSITNDTNNDGFINKSELGTATAASIQVKQASTPGTTPWAANDVITLTLTGTATPLTHTLTAAEATAGSYTFGVPLPAEGATLEANATVTSSASHTVSPAGTDKATLDTSNLTLTTINIDSDADNDGTVTPTELAGTQGKVAVTVNLPHDAAVGDSLTVKASGNTDFVTTLTQADITAGKVTHSFNPTGKDTTFAVSASLHDAAGNTSAAPDVTDQAVMGGAAAPIVTITSDTNNDGFLNASELSTSATTVPVNIVLPDTAVAGDVLHVTLTSNGTNTVKTQTLTQADVTAHSFTYDAPRPAEGSPVVATAYLTGTTGDGPKASDTATVDTTFPSTVTVKIDADTNGDHIVSGTERGTATTTPVTATFDKTKAVVGDTITFTSTTGTAKTVTLTQSDIDAGSVTTNYPLPAIGGAVSSMDVTAQYTDKASNTSAIASYHAGMNTAPTVTGPVTTSLTEDSPVGNAINLIANAHDAENDPLSVVATSVTYQVGTGAAGATVPSGLSLSGNTLTVDTSNAVFQSLAVGQTQTITANYTVSDSNGGTVATSAVTTITGVNDAPVLSSTSITSPAGGLYPVPSPLTPIAGPEINGTPVIAAAAPGWTILSYTPDIISGNGTYPQIFGQTFQGTASNVDGTSLNGGTMQTLLANNASPGGTSTDPAYVNAEETFTNLTGLTVGKQYVFAVQWQQITVADPVNGTFSGGQLVMTVGHTGMITSDPADGYQLNSTNVMHTYTSTGLSDGWNTATIVFTADATTESLVLGINGIVGASVNQGALAVDSLTLGQTPVDPPTQAAGVTLSSLMPQTTDVDSGSSLKGWAVTSAAADTAGGYWEYSQVGGATATDWKALSGASTSAAVFLTPNTFVRWHGATTSHTAFSAVAVDDTSTATEGATLNVSTTGGTTPYSASTATLAAGTGPVVLDLNHDGVISYSHTTMDLNGDGHLVSTAWTGTQDGVLVWDRYQDGQVHDQSQYAFSQYGGATDLAGLKAFDTNGNGLLDAGDALFSQFKVWQDKNGDGKVEAGEMLSLSDLGIKSINLQSDNVSSSPAAGVTQFGQTHAVLASGATMVVADVMFDHTPVVNTYTSVVSQLVEQSTAQVRHI